MSTRKPSKTRRRKTLVAAKLASTIARFENGDKSVLGTLLRLMNDETLSRMQQQAIAVKLAPYFHPKLKRLRPGQVPYDYPFRRDEPTDNLDAESDAQQRERIRKRLFERLD